jgi:hypothetical protein
MGTKDLPSKIASANGRVPSVIKNKPVHIDVNGAYYRLTKARAFSVVEKYASSVARAAAATTPAYRIHHQRLLLHLNTLRPPPLSRSRQRTPTVSST